MYQRTYERHELLGDMKPERGEIHRALEREQKPRGEVLSRDYIWAINGDDVIVRTGQERPGFHPVKAPDRGAYVSFFFHAAPKLGCDRRDFGVSTRRPLFLEVPMDTWAIKKLNAAGIDVLDMENFSFNTRITHSPAASLLTAGYHEWLCGMISGEGKVVNPEALASHMLTGVPAAGARCWGFGTIVLDE